MTFWRTLVWVPILLVGGGYLAYQFFYPGSWLNYVLFAPGLQYRVSVDMTLGGRQMSLAVPVTCTPTVYRDRSQGGGPYGWLREQSRSTLSQPLTTGAAVVVLLPPLCDEVPMPLLEASLPGIAGRPGYVPELLWLDDAAAPTVIEAVLSDQYYREGAAKIGVGRLAVTAEPVGETPPAGAGIPWLAGSGPAHWRGLYAVPIPEALWSTDPALAAALQGLTAPTFLTGTQAQSFEAFRARLGAQIDTWWLPSPVAAAVRSDGTGVANTRVYRLGDRIEPQPLYRFLPVRYDGAVWRVSYDEVGLAVLYPADRTEAIFTAPDQPINLDLGAGAMTTTTVSILLDHAAYIPSTRRLLYFAPLRFSRPVRP